jgi:hypothetical protein
MRISGRARFTARSCELAGKVTDEDVQFDDTLPGTATSYRIPGGRDPGLVAPASLYVSLRALDGSGQVLAETEIGLTNLPPVCPSGLPDAGGPPGGGEGVARDPVLPLGAAAIAGAALALLAWRAARPA